MSAHRCLVRVYRDGAMLVPGDPTDYDGPSNWKFEPVDPEKRAVWAEVASDPARVDQSLWKTRRAGCTTPSATVRLNASGGQEVVITSSEQRADV